MALFIKQLKYKFIHQLNTQSKEKSLIWKFK